MSGPSTDRLLRGLAFHAAMTGATRPLPRTTGFCCSFCAQAAEETAFKSPEARICERCALIALRYYEDVTCQLLTHGRTDIKAAMRRAMEDEGR